MNIIERLRERRAEIEKAARLRISSISDPADERDPQYSDGLRTAVSTALDYSFAAMESGEKHAPQMPVALLGQARLAARSGIGLDRVLRRYVAGYTVLCDFLIQEVENDAGLTGSASLHQIMRAQAVLFERLLADVTAEYARESETRRLSLEERRAERVRRLLAGELHDISDLGYNLEGWHSAIVADPGAVGAIRRMAEGLGQRLLVIQAGKAVWAWLGGGEHPDPAQLKRLISSDWPSQFALGLGEPGQGLDGWRLSHRQAVAAFGVAQHGGGNPSCYGQVALLASALRDDLLETSLYKLFLEPLERERDGGKALRDTLRAYIAAGRQVSSAATALNVDRHTVSSRLRRIENRLACPIADSLAQIEVALRLYELQIGPDFGSVPSPDS